MIEVTATDTSAEPYLQQGMAFAGRYRIERLLGEGERKRTYLARDALLDDRRVALALVKPEAALADPAGTRREMAALSRAGTHDNIVTLYDCGTANGTDYIVAAYLPGGNLRDYIRRRRDSGNLPSAEEIMQCGRQLARALSHVHGQGLIHRDVAPANVWLDERHVAHLGDFDSAVHRDAPDDAVAWSTKADTYLAPEQRAGQQVDARSDLYSLGAVLFEVATGETPDRSTPARITERLAALRSDLPWRLRTTICRLLERSPDDRPRSADQVLEELARVRGTQPSRQDVLPWAQTLPFPLASILWHYVCDPEPAAKVDYLLRFFEALAHFTATVQLSACLSDRTFFDAHKASWFGGGAAGRGRRFDLHRASFGSWVELSKRLSVTGRRLLSAQGDDASRCLKLFTAADRALVEALTSENLTHILVEARDDRNAWSGHGGVADGRLLLERSQDLAQLLSRTRAVFGWSFEPWNLLKPGPMTLLHGVYEVTTALLTGPNPVFVKKQIGLSHPVDATRLYLLNEGNRNALELAPLIRVMAGGKTGQDACYLYSHLHTGQVRWVSYHFHAEPELVLPDTDVGELLATLTSQ